MEEIGKKTEAEEHYRKTIELEPKNIMAYNNYANLLRENAMFYEAEKEVRTALQIEPTNPYALGTLGDIFADEDYFEEAIKEYQKSLKIILKNPDSMKPSSVSEIHNNLGWVYAELKQYSKAKKEFKKAFIFDQMNVKAIRNLRAVGKVDAKPELSKFQIYLAAILLLSLLTSFYLFWINKLSETLFATQSSFLIALFIFIFLYHQLGRFKAGPIEFEKSPGYRFETKSKPSELEHC